MLGGFIFLLTIFLYAMVHVLIEKLLMPWVCSACIYSYMFRVWSLFT